jgi:hypothetical protein
MPAITRKRKHSGDGDEVQQVQAKKFYAVRKGHRTGVFETWKECQEVTAGFAGAMCRFSFVFLEEGELGIWGLGVRVWSAWGGGVLVVD